MITISNTISLCSDLRFCSILNNIPVLCLRIKCINNTFSCSAIVSNHTTSDICIWQFIFKILVKSTSWQTLFLLMNIQKNYFWMTNIHFLSRKGSQPEAKDHTQNDFLTKYFGCFPFDWRYNLIHCALNSNSPQNVLSNLFFLRIETSLYIHLILSHTFRVHILHKLYGKNCAKCWSHGVPFFIKPGLCWRYYCVS